MLCRPVLLPIFLATALAAQAGHALTAEDMMGDYEAVDGTGNTCDLNPATLTVWRGPDHVAFDWPVPFQIFDGQTRTHVEYDLLEERPDALVLRLEGETRRTDAGETVIWLMRPNADLSGFCWGRTDWPLVRCEHAYRRCGETANTS